ncbi:MAG: pseudouridine-5'-phosphate glycosidase [Chthoniobacterales bacterium]|nr:pseudouridine-5'-phosphate glycosidase [Chthoniobacterales bacterium]
MKVVCSPEVKAALDAGRPVVALESTIIAHGMAYPANVETACAVEDVVRENGAVPATIAVLGGVLRAGLTPEEIERFGSDGPQIIKVSVRDLPFVAGKRLDGATTVAATMRIAAMAGIPVFATGGMGGVHRGAEETFDVSADLTEMTRSNVALVTAGAKAILDLPLTLERLETDGVPVIGYGTGEFPAFYSRSSGLKVPMRADTPEDVAAIMRSKWELGLVGAVVVANPIPEEDEIPASEIEPVIASALQEAARLGIRGKDVTPFLLGEIVRATKGRSLQANIALVKNNARVAAQIATAYAKG